MATNLQYCAASILAGHLFSVLPCYSNSSVVVALLPKHLDRLVLGVCGGRDRFSTSDPRNTVHCTACSMPCCTVLYTSSGKNFKEIGPVLLARMIFDKDNQADQHGGVPEL